MRSCSYLSLKRFELNNLGQNSNSEKDLPTRYGMCEICGKSGARQTGPLMIIVETRGKAFRKDRAAMHVKFCKIEVEMRNKLQRLEMLLFAHFRWNFRLVFPPKY